jgi:hypothetical protein
LALAGCASFFTVFGVDVVGFSCFSALIVATNGGAGYNNNFFSVLLI